jgi:phytoene dehydrogenase-like protein
MRSWLREEESIDERYDVIVVGAGVGGATCAALLARRGIKTLLVDKNAILGGKAITMSKQGFRYEFWPICGGPSLDSKFAHVLKELLEGGRDPRRAGRLQRRPCRLRS